MNEAVSVVIVMFALVACQPKPKPGPSQKTVRANGILTTVGKFAEDSFYACMLNGYLQGVPFAQLQEECATKLIEDDKNGFGAGPLGITASQGEFFDPAKISGACGNSGDPTRSQSSGYGSMPPHGGYTYGGDPNKYLGLSKEESERQKKENIASYENAYAKFEKLAAEESKKADELKAAQATGNAAATKKAEEEYEAAKKAAHDQATEAVEASNKAKQDPNEKPPSTSRTVEGASPCEQALQAALELLRECHRTEWKDFRCQQLQALMRACADPALILVDPDQGYTCGVKLDAEMRAALLKAWIARCEQRVTPMPDAPNPCVPPSVSGSGLYLKGKPGDVCNDPAAYIDPDGERCAATFAINKKPFGQPDIHEIIVLAMNRLGGPIIVLPTNPEPPRPGGPDPIPPPP